MATVVARAVWGAGDADRHPAHPLVFLGDVAGQRLQAAQSAARAVRCPGFELNLTVVHYWGHNHIAYAAPESTPPQLAVLVHELENSLRNHHIHFEARPYKPHVTLLRGAQWSDAHLPVMPAVRWQVGEFSGAVTP